jgi:hypothetical protein
MARAVARVIAVTVVVMVAVTVAVTVVIVVGVLVKVVGAVMVDNGGSGDGSCGSLPPPFPVPLRRHYYRFPCSIIYLCDMKIRLVDGMDLARCGKS